MTSLFPLPPSLSASLGAALTFFAAATLAQAEEYATGLSSLPPPPPPSPVADILAAEAPVTPYADPLTLDDAVAQSLAANFDVQIQRLNREAADDKIEIARSSFDPTLALSASTGESQTASPGSFVDSNGDIQIITGSRSESRDSRFSATQRLAATGATLTATGRLARNERSPTNSLLNPAYNSDVGLAIRQPLLRGAGSTVNSAAIDRAVLGSERARADFTAQLFTVIRDVEIAYSNLAVAREQVGIRNFSLEVRKKLLEENTARRDTGVATDLEVLQAEVGVASAARDLLLARQTSRDREDELLRLLGHETFENPVGPVALPPITPPQVDIASSLARARANTPEFTSALASIRQQEIDILAAQNARLPQLDLGLQGGYNETAASASRAASDVWDGDGYSWQADVSLSFPWGFREERARLRQARSGLEREELRYAQIEQEILVSVRSAVRSLQTSIENLRLSSLTASLSQREFEVEKARYDSGLSTFRRVQETQDALDQARLAELQAKVNLRAAQANLDRLEGTAPERYRLTLLP
jgi:outer membrane protein TolC